MRIVQLVAVRLDETEVGVLTEPYARTTWTKHSEQE